jgi:parvulin-like peptidyl-prolyl isomerase
MNRRSAIYLALALITLLASPAAGKVIERIVAVVNKNIILLSQVNERLRPLAQQLKQIPDPAMRKQKRGELRQQILGHMIDELLIKQEADKLKITVSDKDLELAIKDVMRKNNLTREQLESALRQEGKSIAEYKRQILKPQLLRLRVINVQVRSRVSVSDDEIKALYQKNLRALGVETKVRARHIFIAIPPGATGKQVAERSRLARSLLAKAKKEGADFDALAKKHSQDSVTRADGGDLGYFGRGTLPANVEEVVFSMKKGEIRGPLRTERGFHLIQVTDRKESSAKPLSEVKEQLRQEIYAGKVEKATKAWLQEVRKRSFVEVRH